MATSWEQFADRHSDNRSLAVLIAVAVLFSILMCFYNVVDYDVAFLAWAAGKMLQGAVHGRDILEVNPPLSWLIYAPATLLSPLLGLEGGIRVWMLLLTVLSLTCLWQSAGKSVRLPVAATLLLFVTLAFPNHFAQREQIALLLCAPYVAGPAPLRRWGAISGLMAGVGFMLKPYFLITLVAIIVLRRRFGTEERVIVAEGAIYAISLLTIFQPYLLEMVPAATATYWAVGYPWTAIAGHVAFILFPIVSITIAGKLERNTLPYLVATLGFTLAAALQGKGFLYHFIPAYGFLALFLMTATLNNRPNVVFVAVSFLMLEATLVCWAILNWFAMDLNSEQLQITAALNGEIDRSRSYLSLVPEGYAAFPKAIHTQSKYVGTALFPIFIPAVAALAAKGDDTGTNTAANLALSQALRELGNMPSLVITLDVPYVVGGKPFDILRWLERDARFRDGWKNYIPYKDVGPFRLYRRR